MQGERQDVDSSVAEKNDVVKMSTSFSVTPMKGWNVNEQSVNFRFFVKFFKISNLRKIAGICGLLRTYGCRTQRPQMLFCPFPYQKHIAAICRILFTHSVFARIISTANGN